MTCRDGNNERAKHNPTPNHTSMGDTSDNNSSNTISEDELTLNVAKSLKLQYEDFFPEEHGKADLDQRIMKTARRIVRSTREEFNRTVPAYQLFEQGSRPLAPRQVGKRFKNAEWDTMGTTHNPISSLNDEIILTLEEDINSRLESMSHPSLVKGDFRFGIEYIEDSTRQIATKLVSELKVTNYTDHYKKLIDAITASTMKMLGPLVEPCMDYNPVAEITALKSFMPYVCGHDSFDSFKKSGSHSVRAHELYRYAHEIGYKPDKLTIEISKLASGVMLFEPQASHLSILQHHGGIDAAIDAWLSEYDNETKGEDGDWK